MVLKGTAIGSIIGIPVNIPSTLESFSLTNGTGGALTATVSIIEFNTNNKVAVFTKSISANSTESNDVPIKILSGYTIYLAVSGSIDYYFSIK